MAAIDQGNSPLVFAGAESETSISESLIDRAQYQRPPGQNLVVMAHQGWQEIGRPNSFRGITETFGKADAVEFDIYAVPKAPGSNEIEIVCCHPEGYFLFVNQNGMKNTENLPLTYEDTKKFIVDGEPLIPRLADVLEVYNERSEKYGKRTELQIELKGPGTPVEVIKPLQDLIAAGKIGYEDFLLTGLCYPGDRSRIEDPLRLDPQVRMVLVARGGDYAQDGFEGQEDFLQYARERERIECITIQRRGSSFADMQRILEAGFDAGCFHVRTSDELRQMLAWAAKATAGSDNKMYVAADCYTSPSHEYYPAVELNGAPFALEVGATGFYMLRDWIWEMGWDAEAIRKDPAASEALQVAGALLAPNGSTDAALRHSLLDGTVRLQVCKQGELSNEVLDYSDVRVAEKYLGEFDAGAPYRSYAEFLSPTALESSFARLSAALLEARGASVPAVVSFSLDEIVALSEGRSAEILRKSPVEFDGVQLQVFEEAGREVLTRAGRIIGMLGFTALMPRHMEKENFTLALNSPLIDASVWTRLAADEQVQAQLLRSGKRGQVISLDGSDVLTD